MKNAIILFIFILTTLNLKSQMNITLPEGYETYKDYGKEVRNDNDFDNDGITDLAIVCTDKNGLKIIVIYLSTKYLVNQVYSWFPWNYEMVDFKYKNNVLDITFDDGRSSTTFKLKYYLNLSNMKLIGYDENANMFNTNTSQMMHLYSKNINLNTGEYEIDGVKRKISIDLITISNIEKYFEYLSSIGDNYQK